MFRKIAAIAAGMLLLGGSVQAQEPSAEEKAFIAKMEGLRDSLKPQTGVIALPAAKATLNLGEAYYFLSAKDARKVLTEGWGNPPEAADGVLGMVFATGTDFLTKGAWGGVLTFEETGFVTDEDAASEDFNTVLSQMKEGEEERNKALVGQGYAPTHLIGWAQPPSYDAARHDLVWAREIQFGDETDHTLNYDVRHLGRHGVLSISLVSQMSHLGEVQPAAAALARTAEFDAGSTYADFKKGDKTAGYGLAGLVAAGAGLAVAKKAGVLAILLLVLKKGGVFILGGLAAAGGWFRTRFGKKKAASPRPGDQNDGDDASTP